MVVVRGKEVGDDNEVDVDADDECDVAVEEEEEVEEDDDRVPNADHPAKREAVGVVGDMGESGGSSTLRPPLSRRLRENA